MRTFEKLITGCFLLSLFIFSCQPTEDIESSTSIFINNASTKFYLSDILSIEGYTILNNSSQFPIRGINRLLFFNNKIITLDRETDFENVYVFDQTTGNFLNTIGRQSETEQDAYDGVMDICLDENSNICMLAAGKQSFMTYDLSGKFISAMPNGMYGDRLVAVPKSAGHLIYNEMSANEVSADYYLLFFDNSGNLIKRLVQYPKSCNGQSYEFTGFLTSCGSNIWFSPPFCDTIYMVDKNNIFPRYILNFDKPAIPTSLINKNSTGWDFDKSPYLCEKFACTDNMVVFEFMENSRVNLGLYDETRNHFYKFSDSSKDFLSDLIQAGDIYPRNAKSFALLIRPNRIKYLINNNLLDENGLNKNYPNLLADIKAAYTDNKYLVLYLTGH